LRKQNCCPSFLRNWTNWKPKEKQGLEHAKRLSNAAAPCLHANGD
jgi:hypothetical protein